MAVLVRSFAVSPGARSRGCTRCTGLIGGSQSGQNTTSRPRTGREVVLRTDLDLDFDLAGVRGVIANFLFPVPCCQALSEDLRNTYADATGQGPAHRR
jgi:hypothetical protein